MNKIDPPSTDPKGDADAPIPARGIRMPRRTRQSNKIAGESKFARRIRRANAMKQRKQIHVTPAQHAAIVERMKAEESMSSARAVPGEAPSAVSAVLDVADDGGVK